MNHLKLNLTLFVALLSFLFTSCSSTKTALYDQYSYQKTIEIKVEASNLMNEATTPYVSHKKEVDALFLNIDKLVEYEKSKLNNEITLAMWKMVTDKEKNFLATFFKRWETKETLSPVFLEESKKQVLEAFDLLIQYEIKKDKESKDALLDLINQ
ncbi:hypothetical protein [Flavobacterium humidisoli]|uniref:Lipoprotein n=1 Tax=Flavobacterium humidisoli TaxID=2937442 RepID=A0ABY4LXG6_9FLAO|nr:hypothetical protein [Flavobacterium humidisoli]UPZ17766.1 hypothetical protein M0M44_10550 [Flavobacterium humidisoli]